MFMECGTFPDREPARTELRAIYASFESVLFIIINIMNDKLILTN